MLIVGGFMLALVAATGAQAQGRYRGRAYSKADVDRIIKRVEERSDAFKDQVDASLDRSRLDGTKREDNINDQIEDLEKALDELREEFDRAQKHEETREQVHKMLDEAYEVNGLMKRLRLSARAESTWALLRSDLNRLAGIYNLRLIR
jgi:predicted ribosome quality control (RQC) complex YloA/Tae2 family protein